MKRMLISLVCCLALLATSSLHAQQTKSPQLIKLFRSVIAKPSESTVRVSVAGRPVALGIILSSDGWILTKHSELKGDKIACTLADGSAFEAELIGFDGPYDLAMLKIDAEDLTPVAWSDSKASRVGHWVACAGVGKDPVAVGVLSVASRVVKGAKKYVPTRSGGGYLGIALDLTFAGVKVEEVFQDRPAHAAGLKAGDLILEVNGEKVENMEEFREVLSRHRPGEEIKLKIARADRGQELAVKLGQGPGFKGGKSRSDQQNHMGSKLSERRAGFPIILQHDSVLSPADCGGPLCNLEGQVIGINIARAGRTETYAIPSEAVRPLLEKLKTPNKEK